MKSVSSFGILLCILCVSAEHLAPKVAVHASHVGSKKNTIGGDNTMGIIQAIFQIKCADECGNSDDCLSFVYNKITKACQLHGKKFHLTGGILKKHDGFKYYEITNRRLIGGNCNTNSDCIVKGSECRQDGECGCVAGWSFQSETHTCESECSAYGRTFQKFTGWLLSGFNTDTAVDSSAELCEAKCLNAVGYTCRSWEINSANKCYIQELDASDVPASYKPSHVYEYYQRNCN